MASGERVSAIRIAQPVAAGEQIPESALEEVQVGDTGIQFISWSERAKVTRHVAAVRLVRGALLTNSMIVPGDAPQNGRLIVGLALKPGQFPSGGLEVGRHVTLYAVGGGQNGGPRPRAPSCRRTPSWSASAATGTPAASAAPGSAPTRPASTSPSRRATRRR